MDDSQLCCDTRLRVLPPFRSGAGWLPDRRAAGALQGSRMDMLGCSSADYGAVSTIAQAPTRHAALCLNRVPQSRSPGALRLGRKQTQESCDRLGCGEFPGSAVLARDVVLRLRIADYVFALDIPFDLSPQALRHIPQVTGDHRV